MLFRFYCEAAFFQWPDGGLIAVLGYGKGYHSALLGAYAEVL